MYILSIYIVIWNMIIELAKWGNSLGFRLKKNLCQQLDVDLGSKFLVEVKNGKLILEPMDLADYSQEIDLRYLVDQISESNRHDACDDLIVGDEIW